MLNAFEYACLSPLPSSTFRNLCTELDIAVFNTEKNDIRLPARLNIPKSLTPNVWRTNRDVYKVIIVTKNILMYRIIVFFAIVLLRDDILIFVI